MAAGNTPSNTADELLNFIRAAKERGVADEFIVAMLRQNGWPERLVFRTFSSYYAKVLETDVPARTRNVEYARDAFYYLLNFMTLGFWTVSLGQIWYILIARWFPDPSQTDIFAQSLRDEISWQVATVIVAFPVFLFVHNLIRRELNRRPDLYDSGVRKWLTYLALVLAALVVLTDAVWFISALLRGELTVRFILDSLVLLVLGGGVFAYYLLTIDPPAAA
jgi:Domain of unknown function (DUF5671)